MQHQPHPSHSRTQFQIDRIAFFSDAVIAIALTLMILEFKIPELGEKTSFREILQLHGGSMLIHGLALFVAFWTIGNLWMHHHQLFENIVNYNEKMTRVNLYFLFTVMLLPISISFLFAKNEPYFLKMLFYFSNLFITSATYSLLLYIVFNPKNKFSSLTDRKKISEIKDNAYLGSVVFLITLIMIIFGIRFFWVAFLLFPMSRILKLIKTKLFGSRVAA